jgi:hypothetical protein
MAQEQSKKIAEIVHRFGYHPANTDARIEAHEDIRALFCGVALEIDRLMPDSREKSVVMTKIEEAMFWGNAGIAREVTE